MPPKPKLRKDDIVEIAFDHVRKYGWEGLTARYLAEKLNTSTKPIYFHFSSMKEIEEAVVKNAMDLILKYTTTSRTGDPWIDHSVGVVMFAVEEKHLFRSIFDEKHVEVRKKHSVQVWSTGEESLTDHPLFKDLNDHQIEIIRRVRWIFTHGLASLLNISNWQFEGEERLIQAIERISRAVYNEFKNDPDILMDKISFQKPTPGKLADQKSRARPNC